MSQTEANARPDTLRRVGRPTIGDERNEVLRRLLREIRAQEFDDNLSATARAIGVEPGTLSDFLNEKRGAGTKIMDGLTKHLRRGMDQIIASGGDLGALRGQSSPTPLSRQVTFGDLPNWPGLLAAAKTQRPSHALWVWEQLAQARVWLDGAVTPSLVALDVGGRERRCRPSRPRVGRGASGLKPPSNRGVSQKRTKDLDSSFGLA